MTNIAPLSGVVVFFDLKENLTDLVGTIKDLGGEVDDFFSVNRITLLVTNKKPPAAVARKEDTRATSTRDVESQAAKSASKSTGTEDTESINSGRHNKTCPASTGKTPNHRGVAATNNSHLSAAIKV